MASTTCRSPSSKVKDELIYKLLETMEKYKDDLVAVQPVLREFTPAFGYKQYGVAYHPGALSSSRSTISRPGRWIDRAHPAAMTT